MNNMNHLNATQRQYLSEIVEKLSGAMKKIKFTREMSRDEADAIRKELGYVQGELEVFADINPEVKQIELFKKTADFSQNMLETLIGGGHLV
ncbi:hypothetical protein ACQE3D_09695 [Methylomonas sp. MS20]|uniref:hypothetical protein n=1 Tax=unclassified Methylomonas TaxID=2608980 RepID=UPI0028A3B771|nr:hypothetical protein [Methylomonas sp. MV1]MDT4328728.1 hypothetical protein [Methylomonas sp. MV1]